MLSRFLGARSAHSVSYVSDEQRRNRPIAGLPKGPGRFWAAPSRCSAYRLHSLRASHRFGSLQNRLRRIVPLFSLPALSLAASLSHAASARAPVVDPVPAITVPSGSLGAGIQGSILIPSPMLPAGLVAIPALASPSPVPSVLPSAAPAAAVTAVAAIAARPLAAI